jgi:hypothetical protein
MTTIYVDPDTIRRKGNMVKMWRLSDFKTIQPGAGTPFLSSKSQSECDCVEERSRMLAFTWFFGNMGSGKVVYANSDEGKWEPVEPESIAEAMWKVACAKK